MEAMLRMLGILLVGVGERAEVLLGVVLGAYGHKERIRRTFPSFGSYLLIHKFLFPLFKYFQIFRCDHFRFQSSLHISYLIC